MQEAQLRLFSGEAQQTIEHVHPYGFTSVPQPRTGGADSGMGGTLDAAEAIVVYLNGNRSHGVAVVTGDRRFRLGGLQPGEVAHHDDQTHQRVIHRDGIYDAAPNNKIHQQRVMKPGDAVKGGLAQLASAAGSLFGQLPWKTKTPFSYKHHDANLHQGQHPKTINHHVINGDAIPPASGGASALPQAIGQIPGMASQLSAMVTAGVGLPGVNAIAAQINTSATALSILPGYDTNVAAIAVELAATSSTIAGMNTFTGMSTLATQLNSLVSQLSGMAGGGISQIIHAHSLDQIKGILHSAFQGQHTTTHDTNGVTSISPTAVTDTAPNINHDGNTNVSNTLTVGAPVYAPIYDTTSDGRLKSDDADLGPVLDVLLGLKVRTFNKRRVHHDHDGKPSISPEPGFPSLGFHAQDLRASLPASLHEVLVHGDEAKGFLGVDEMKFGVLATKALQEYVAKADAKNAAADAKIAALTARVAALEARHA